MPRAASAKVERTKDVGRGLLIDFGADDVPMGIEITAPSAVTIADVNAVLAGLDLLREEEWVPLRAA